MLSIKIIEHNKNPGEHSAILYQNNDLLQAFVKYTEAERTRPV